MLDSLLRVARRRIQAEYSRPGRRADGGEEFAPGRLLAKALDGVKVEQEGTRVVVSRRLDQDLANGLITAVAQVRVATRRMQSTNNLKQIALAMHSYHDTMGRFPPAIVRDKEGKPLYSWRVLLLPYLEQQNLYNQFKLDEPWDSEHNRP